MMNNIFCKTETYTISEFLNDKHKVESNGFDKLSYAFLLPFNLPDPMKDFMETPLVEYNFKHEVGNNTLQNFTQFNETLKTFLDIIQNPMLIVKSILTFLVDISFPVAAMVVIGALCAYVFSGCKDKKPLSWVGISVAIMYMFNVIVVQFINMI